MHIFSLMQTQGHKPNHITYTALISAYVKQKQVNKAMELFEQLVTDMKYTGVKPNAITCIEIVKGNIYEKQLSHIIGLLELLEMNSLLKRE